MTSNRSTLTLGSDPNLIAAQQALIEGLRLGRHIDELRPHCEILEAAWDRALRTPEGREYLEARPTLKQEVENRWRKSGRISESPKPRCEGEPYIARENSDRSA